ncbi:MAG TPA: molybdopterin-dependent oxidoreductase [Planctomycetota bacterium]|nr:molybdopterin-dependent oxidoreductase [Planctomycetota bacterium]
MIPSDLPPGVDPLEAARRLAARRAFLARAAAGAGFVVCGYACDAASEARTLEASRETTPSGKPRLPPGQYLLDTLRPMGGAAGDPRPSQWRLRVHGAVERPLEIDYRRLLELPQTEQLADVHCVTAWSVLGAAWKGVSLALLADEAKVRRDARHVIFEAAHGYTANVPIGEALAPNVLVAHAFEGRPLARDHGPPVRALVPDLYFWKSAKWLVGVRFVERDEPGYWETRGYHNHGDPWKEERYA